MQLCLGSSKKFANVKAVEVKPSVTESSAYYQSPYYGGENVNINHEDYIPEVEVTVHSKDGTSVSAKESGEPFFGRKDKAERAANQAAQAAADHLAAQGVPVIYDSPAAKAARNAYKENPAMLALFAAQDAEAAAQAQVEKIARWLLPLLLVAVAAGLVLCLLIGA